MSGYSYRKKITIDKSKVVPTTVNSGLVTIKQDLVNFPVLVVLQDDDLIHVPGSCGNKVTNIGGLDISFALSTNPAVPINFQLEDYEPETGKLTCWVKAGLLSASGTATAATAFYLYYGSGLLHDPFSQNGINIWSAEFSRVWHLKNDVAPAVCRDAQSGSSAQTLTGSPETGGTAFVSAKIGHGISPGMNSYFQAQKDTSAAFSISVWIKAQATGIDQVIMANDSTNGSLRNGYAFKIDGLGNLKLEFYRNQTFSQIDIPLIHDPALWHLLHITVSGTQLSVLINGIQKHSINSLKMGSGGSIRVGSSKQNTGHYSGIIDEIRIQRAVKKIEWFRTQYINQDSPLQFYTVSEEEYSPAEFASFMGALNNSWNVAANWASGSLPISGANVVITGGRSANVSGNSVNVNRLLIKAGALLSLNADMVVGCEAEVEQSGSMTLNNNAGLSVIGNLINDGSIESGVTSGRLIFAGTQPTQLLTGTGKIKVDQLENDQLLRTNDLILNADVQIIKYLRLKKGTLSTNGNLSLLTTADPDGTAAILAIPVNEASITGDVKVKQYIEGDFPYPATARDWRLVSSPVYTTTNSSLKAYGIDAYKNSMFITGPGGASAGFDPSPLNSSTVYTHDQSLEGNLSQKYLPIGNIHQKVPLGRGIYIFSRGSRSASNAYNTQIAQKPFSNPSHYYLTHVGGVLTGDLSVELNNRNSGSQGDGFNLLGNPYPAPIAWGNLLKSDLSPYVWLYDPLNKAYYVSDDINTIIPVGHAFFVKVISGKANGRLTFTEQSKFVVPGSTPTASRTAIRMSLDNFSHDQKESTLADRHLRVTLHRNQFIQRYKVCFDPNGNDGLDNDDALKMGDGFVNISALINNTKLSAERRSLSKENQEIFLSVAVWENGPYKMDMAPSKDLLEWANVTLIDHLLNKEIKLSDTSNIYSFNLSAKTPQEEVSSRFSVKISPAESRNGSMDDKDDIVIYPNPVTDLLFLRSGRKEIRDIRIVFTDILGRQVFNRRAIISQVPASVDCQNLPKGLYFISIYELNTSGAIAAFKMIKH